MKQRLVDRLNDSNLSCIAAFILLAAPLSAWLLGFPRLPDDHLLGLMLLGLLLGSSVASQLERSGDELQRIVSILNQSAPAKRRRVKGSVIWFFIMVGILLAYAVFGTQMAKVKGLPWILLILWAITSFGEAMMYINEQLSSISASLAGPVGEALRLRKDPNARL